LSGLGVLDVFHVRDRFANRHYFGSLSFSSPGYKLVPDYNHGALILPVSALCAAWILTHRLTRLYRIRGSIGICCADCGACSLHQSLYARTCPFGGSGIAFFGCSGLRALFFSSSLISL